MDEHALYGALVWARDWNKPKYDKRDWPGEEDAADALLEAVGWFRMYAFDHDDMCVECHTGSRGGFTPHAEGCTVDRWLRVAAEAGTE